jgi:polyhydroxybutyrate depolymerase
LPTPDGTGTLGTDVDAVSGGEDDLPVTVRFSFWPGREGCDGDLVDTPFADGVAVWQAAGCGSGRLYVVEGGGHSWPGSSFDAGIPDYVGATTMSISATDLIWGFFRQHPITSP